MNKLNFIYFLSISIFFYASHLHSQNQTFIWKDGNSNPLYGLSVEIDFNPTFVDIDNDGDLDAFSGNYAGNFNFYRNEGSSTNPIFINLTSTLSDPLKDSNISGNRTRMEFVDIDNDGDFDLFCGLNTGFIYFWENIGTSSYATFTPISNTDYFNRDFGSHTNIEFVDIDDDGDFDAFISDSTSNIYYYQNEGTVVEPLFIEKTGDLNPFTTPASFTYLYGDFADMDNDGDMDFYTGCLQGITHYYLNTGSASLPNFELQSPTNNLLLYGYGNNSRPDICLTDINSDNIIDAFIGLKSGGVALYYEGFSNTLSVNSFNKPTIKFYPNPFKEILNIFGELEEVSFCIFDVLGNEVVSNITSKKVDLSFLNKGIYFVKVTINGNVVDIQKIVKN